MEIGSIVEYIDSQKIICAVVIDIKKQRLHLLNESNKEVNLSQGRLSLNGRTKLDPGIGRDHLIKKLQERAQVRQNLVEKIDIQELWEILNTEQEWIDLETMVSFCFDTDITDDHYSAVVRAFFANKIYFKFNVDRFFPFTSEQVEQIMAQAREAERKQQLIESGYAWLKSAIESKQYNIPDDKQEIVALIKSYFLFEKQSPASDVAKDIVSRLGIDKSSLIFDLLIKFKVFHEDENLDLHRFQVSTDFPEDIVCAACNLVKNRPATFEKEPRKDFTDIPLMTIDGQATLDFDDAISIVDHGNYLELGVHIADVGYYIDKDSLIDTEAANRGSSIYMPDQKIPMLPPILSEDLCSLKQGELRPAISMMIQMDRAAKILGFNIVPSVVNVQNQQTYYDVNVSAEDDQQIILLYDIAKKFRDSRIGNGAVQIVLPEINLWLNESGELVLSKVNRESPGRMLVSEIMIMANWVMAQFLKQNNVPTVYRGQVDIKERLYKENDFSLFKNWMQRKLLSRFILSPEPEKHCGLGLDVYLTATSPIRKYFDLITQRQVRATLGLEDPYTFEQIEDIIARMEQPMSSVARLQYKRHKYWKLKFLEKRIGQKEEALVLSKRRDGYLILLTEYLIECVLPGGAAINLKPEDHIQVKIQHVNARKDVLFVFMT